MAMEYDLKDEDYILVDAEEEVTLMLIFTLGKVVQRLMEIVRYLH